MRFVKMFLMSAGMSLGTVATAMAAPLAMLQDPQTAPTQVEVHHTETQTVWFTNPLWLAIGGLVVLLIIVLAVMAARGGRDSSSTTIVR